MTGAQDELAIRLRQSMRGRDLIIGVDRLDYSKGIGQRLEAFERYLETHAEQRNQVSMLQITPRSRSEVPEYQDMEQQVAEHVGRINGAFSDVDWVPIRYVNSPIPHTSLAGLYRMAKVGLVTPLRDGMNLVAKEFVAAQPEDDPGVLVLSRFAGAVHELDCALIVNPYDADATAAAIARALEMPLAERQERLAADDGPARSQLDERLGGAPSCPCSKAEPVTAQPHAPPTWSRSRCASTSSGAGLGPGFGRLRRGPSAPARPLRRRRAGGSARRRRSRRRRRARRHARGRLLARAGGEPRRRRSSGEALAEAAGT